MIRLSTIFWLTLAAVAAFGVFDFKYKVQALEAQLVALDGEILRTQEATHVLQAEWSYLNEPRRLEELAHRFLPMAPLAPGQITTVDLLPLPKLGPDDEPGDSGLGAGGTGVRGPDQDVPYDSEGIKSLIGRLPKEAKALSGTKTAKAIQNSPQNSLGLTLVSTAVRSGNAPASAVKP